MPVNFAAVMRAYQWDSMNRKHLLLLYLLVACPVSAVAQDDEPPWMNLLKAQLDHDEYCDLKYVMSVREFRRAKKEIVEGRAHCADGRNYLFSRQQDEMLFRLEQCDAQSCSDNQAMTKLGLHAE